VNAEIREILEYVSDHPEMKTREAVDSYFDQIIWSIEKAEWKKLSDEEKQVFVDALDAAKRKAPEGAL
jgi:uncharacterized protein YaaW (UPF0174 family)